MLRKGVQPIPPAKKTSGIFGSFGRTKSPIGDEIATSSPGFRFASVCLKVLLPSGIIFVVIDNTSSVGELDNVNQRFSPLLSLSLWGRYNSINCPAI